MIRVMIVCACMFLFRVYAPAGVEIDPDPLSSFMGLKWGTSPEEVLRMFGKRALIAENATCIVAANLAYGGIQLDRVVFTFAPRSTQREWPDLEVMVAGRLATMAPSPYMLEQAKRFRLGQYGEFLFTGVNIVMSPESFEALFAQFAQRLGPAVFTPMGKDEMDPQGRKSFYATWERPETGRRVILMKICNEKELSLAFFMPVGKLRDGVFLY
jgi:hypothetical protein